MFEIAGLEIDNKILNWLDVFWHYKLFSIGKVPLTVNSLVISIIMLMLTFRMAHWSANLFSKRIVNKVTDDLNAQSVINRLVFHGMVIVCIMVSLSVAGIPLSVFTVLGGALAIGVGFGSQNLMSNFFAGLIMLVEKPIKVGDIIEVDGVLGKVKEIGTRSTRIEAFDQKINVVPNSFFLEKGFLNWSIGSQTLRAEVLVGVAYGSDVRLVEQICHDAFKSLQGILTTPAPMVLFNHFGNSALEFRLLFWVDLKGSHKLIQVQSELRFTLYELFQQKGIEIPFAQNDVNFKSPLTIELNHKNHNT